jgi:hypothetical protein
LANVVCSFGHFFRGPGDVCAGCSYCFRLLMVEVFFVVS